MLIQTTIERLEEDIEQIIDKYQLVFHIGLQKKNVDWVNFWPALRYDIIVALADANDEELDAIDAQVMEQERSDNAGQIQQPRIPVR